MHARALMKYSATGKIKCVNEALKEMSRSAYCQQMLKCGQHLKKFQVLDFPFKDRTRILCVDGSWWVRCTASPSSTCRRNWGPKPVKYP